MADDDYLHLSDLGAIADAVLGKIQGTRNPASRIEFGTIQTIDNVNGQVPRASVLLNGAPTSRPVYPTVLVDPTHLGPGVRVAILWDDPHQCYIIGTLAASPPPAIRVTLDCVAVSTINALENCGVTNDWVVPSATTITLFEASATFPFSGPIDLKVNGATASTLTFVASSAESTSLSIALAPGDTVAFDTNGANAAASIQVNTGGLDTTLVFGGCL